MSKLIRIACLALIGAAGGTAYAGGQQETEATTTGKAQERKDAADEKPAAAQRLAPATRGVATPAPGGSKPQQVTVTGTRANDTEQRRARALGARR